MPSKKGSAKIVRNLNTGTLNFKENQVVSEKEAMIQLLYSIKKDDTIINPETLRKYKSLYKKGVLRPNIIEEFMKASGFEKVSTQWKFINKIK